MTIAKSADKHNSYVFNIFGQDIALPVNLEIVNSSDCIAKYSIEYLDGNELTNYLLNKNERFFVFEDEITIISLSRYKYLIHFDWNRPNWQIHSIILKIAIPYILSQEGYGFLHAATVSNNNFAISFVGHQESGKTTISRYFLENNFSLISDDICGFKKYNNNIVVYTAENKQRLREESYLYYLKKHSKSNFKNGIRLREKLIDGSYDTRFICKVDNKSGHKILNNIFILQNSDCLECVELSKNEAFKELIHYSSNTIKKNFSNESFQRLHELTNLCKVSILRYPKNLELLPDIYTLVNSKITS
jgi:hypothetical protein